MINYIAVDKLYPHKNNPRKDLGDLTELAASIKKSGIMQNLTAVQDYDGDYTIIIGHRRLAAAKLAGLTEVPVSIVEMNEKDQLATMLLENMQRSDLTLIEEAEGIQMMLDIGESVQSVSEMTGFSETKIRHRAKLMELDSDKLKNSVRRGASITDYIKLEEIKDEELKNSLLDSIGTDNFDYELRRAKRMEEEMIYEESTKAQLDVFAEYITEDALEELACIGEKNYIKNSKHTVRVPEDADERKYYYAESSYYFTLYKEKTLEEIQKENERDVEREKERQKKKEQEAALKTDTADAYALRREFAESVSNKTAKAHRDEIIEAMYLAMTKMDEFAWRGYYADYNDILEKLDLSFETGDADERSERTKEKISGAVSKEPEKYLFLAVYHAVESENLQYYNNWTLEFEKEPSLDIIYDTLLKLGYKMSDVEKQLKDGTHPQFKKAGA